MMGEKLAPEHSTSAAAAQAAWIMGRLDYISRFVGLRWADGIVATLRGDFRVHVDQHSQALNRVIAADRAPWLKSIAGSDLAARYQVEKPGPLLYPLTEQRQISPVRIHFDVS